MAKEMTATARVLTITVLLFLIFPALDGWCPLVAPQRGEKLELPDISGVKPEKKQAQPRGEDNFLRPGITDNPAFSPSASSPRGTVPQSTPALPEASSVIENPGTQPESPRAGGDLGSPASGQGEDSASPEEKESPGSQQETGLERSGTPIKPGDAGSTVEPAAGTTAGRDAAPGYDTPSGEPVETVPGSSSGGASSSGKSSRFSEPGEGEEGEGDAGLSSSAATRRMESSPSKEGVKSKKKKRRPSTADVVTGTWIPIALIAIALAGLWIFRRRTEELKKTP
jgi:hypothetical protein